jgi:uncharacterized protein YxjI
MFHKTTYLIKEHISFLKLVDQYDIIDVETGQTVAYAKETVSGWAKYARLLISKHHLPTSVAIHAASDHSLLYRMQKPAALFRVRVNLYNANNNFLGYYKSRILSIGGTFDVFKPDNTKVAEIKGNWIGWDFTFKDLKGKQLGQITKKWTGIGKELFTTADNYIVSIHPDLKDNQDFIALLLMAGLAVDIVFKEQQ